MKHKRISSFLMVVILLVAMMGAAYATEYSSASKSVTVYGHEYDYWSSINSTDDTLVLYSTYGTAIDGTPQGYMGLRPRLYLEDGTLIEAVDWHYNDSDYAVTSSLRVPWIYKDGVPGEYYYSRGQAKFYNGNGYTTYTCNASSNIRVPLTARSIQINARGEVYGSELFLEELGVEADLIRVKGNNGEIGFVKNADLNLDDCVDNPSDALNVVNGISKDRNILVYASDGETVVDTFTVLGGGALEAAN